MPIGALQKFIADHDNEHSYAIGIFTRTGVQIGFYEIVCDLNHLFAEFKLVIGDKAFWGQNVVNETRAALLDHFFDYRKFEKAIGMPNARNFAAIRNYKAQGWRLEGIQRGQVKSVLDGRRIDQLMFGMLASDWRDREKGFGPMNMDSARELLAEALQKMPEEISDDASIATLESWTASRTPGCCSPWKAGSAANCRPTRSWKSIPCAPSPGCSANRPRPGRGASPRRIELAARRPVSSQAPAVLSHCGGKNFV